MNECQATTSASGSTDAAVTDDLLPVELIILDHYARQTRCTLRHLPAILGRNERAEVMLTDPWVSHEHCKLLQHEGQVIVRDMESKNGVFMHGVRVLEAEVHSGDCITLGRTEITIRYRESASGLESDSTPEHRPTRPPNVAGPHTEELLY
jgi:pSer/pThr/pTyr-binding forkhead associated (FHA) protein